MSNIEQAFTGERFLPDVIAGPIRFEHLHRYAVAGLFATNKVVLDIACGDGYGSALLYQNANAAQVFGVDIDEPTIVRAKELYAAFPAIKFLVGSTDAIPLPDASVDYIVSFETIEHHDKHSLMLQEFNRVLKPGGIVVLSSPNRPVYSEGRDYTNPFHVKELNGNELLTEVGEWFPAIRLWGQKLRGASFLYPVSSELEFTGSIAQGFATYSPTSDKEWNVQTGIAFEPPMYFLAVCARIESDLPSTELLNAVPSLFADAKDDLIRAEIARIAAEMAQGFAQKYEGELENRQKELVRTQEAFQSVRAEADDLMEQRNTLLAQTQLLEQERNGLRSQIEKAAELLNEWESGPYGKLRRTVRQMRGVKAE